MLPLMCCRRVLHLCASLTAASRCPAGFNRVRMLTPDAGMIICALAGSRLVELSADGMLLRPHSNWRQWVMPEAQRDNAAHIALAAAAAAAAEAAERMAAAQQAPSGELSNWLVPGCAAGGVSAARWWGIW